MGLDIPAPLQENLPFIKVFKLFIKIQYFAKILKKNDFLKFIMVIFDFLKSSVENVREEKLKGKIEKKWKMSLKSINYFYIYFIFI